MGARYTLRKRMDALNEGEAAVCSVVKAELFFGAMRSQNPQKSLENQRNFLTLFTSFPFDDAAAEPYGRVRADLAAQGKPIGGNDLMIATIALAKGPILVTHNTDEFRRISGLQTEDWEHE